MKLFYFASQTLFHFKICKFGTFLKNKFLFNSSKFTFSRAESNYNQFMDLKSVIKVLEAVLPPELAEKWDKTGLLLKPENDIQVSSIFFTIDLTEKVLEEAISLKTNLIIAYHPPIFSPMPKLLSDQWKDRIVMKCVRHSIAVYSPHTVCDIVVGGVNDWLIKCFDVCQTHAISSKQDFADVNSVFKFTLPLTVNFKKFMESLSEFKVISYSEYDKTQYITLSTLLPQTQALKILTSHNDVEHVSVTSAVRYDIQKGIGRVAKLRSPKNLKDCIDAVKSYLNLKHLRVSLGVGHTLNTEIEKIAVCAGSGASVLKDVDADLFLTGEMSHHEVLHAIHNKTSIILVEHTNSERGYLESLVTLLQPQLRNVKLNISSVDKDPISIM